MKNNFFHKLRIIWQRPIVIVVTGLGRETTSLAIRQVLQNHFTIGKKVLLYSTDSPDSADFAFLVKKARMALLVATHTGQYEQEKEFFSGSAPDVAKIAKLVNLLVAKDRLVFNFDDETVRDLKNQSPTLSLAFGFAARADVRATDIVLTESNTNFKINYQGNTVPVWLPNLFGKEEIYAALAAATVGEILDLNLVEISESLKLTKSIF
jgi:hypothetical protein